MNEVDLMNIFLERGHEIFKMFFDNYSDEEAKSIFEKRNESGLTLVQSAMACHDLETVEYLIKRGANVDDEYDGNSMLLVALITNLTDIVKLLLSYNADANFSNKDGRKPVHALALANDDNIEVFSELLDLLLKHNANINCIDNYGNTALHLAIHSDNFKCAKLLIEKGIDKTVKTKDGETALSMARKIGNFDLVKMLS